MRPFLFILLIPFLLALPARAQSEESVLQDIETAFETGDAGALGRHVAERMELTLDGAASIYSRGQAVYVLAEFFREFPPVRTILDEPTHSGNDAFVLGQYHTIQENDPLRVFLRLKSNAGRWEVREIRIEPPAG